MKELNAFLFDIPNSREFFDVLDESKKIYTDLDTFSSIFNSISDSLDVSLNFDRDTKIRDEFTGLK